MDARITEIFERWFLLEPALFSVACLHEVVVNESMDCPVRTGHRKLEYNPLFTDNMSDTGLEEALRTEAIRILLKHPYERRPDGCSPQAISIGSNLTISDNYGYDRLRIETPEDYNLASRMPYEWYAYRIQELLPPNGGGSAQSESEAAGFRDLSELWEEDDVTSRLINGAIENCRNWGSLPYYFAERLKASTRATINWHNVFSGFRASLLSSQRKLTRMRPNRRLEFEAMGSTRRFDTRLLVAVDTSGSVSSQSLSYFYGVINRAFRYGFEQIDVIQFDCDVNNITTLRKKMDEVTVKGRGGTNFQNPVDYAVKHAYDGLIILTDGYAPAPQLPDHCRTKLLWVCESQSSYNKNHEWMEKTGRACVMSATGG